MPFDSLEEAAGLGMTVAYHAARQPEESALVTNFGQRSWSQFNANTNRIVRMLRERGLKDGDAVAVASRNRPEFVEMLYAATRGGLRFTPINFHLKGEEMGYIADNCDARAVLVDTGLGAPAQECRTFGPRVEHWFSCDGPLDGFEDPAGPRACTAGTGRRRFCRDPAPPGTSLPVGTGACARAPPITQHR
jgi:long-chain acyl-CoA synthetase